MITEALAGACLTAAPALTPLSEPKTGFLLLSCGSATGNQLLATYALALYVPQRFSEPGGVPGGSAESPGGLLKPLRHIKAQSCEGVKTGAVSIRAGQLLLQAGGARSVALPGFSYTPIQTHERSGRWLVLFPQGAVLCLPWPPVRG